MSDNIEKSSGSVATVDVGHDVHGDVMVAGRDVIVKKERLSRGERLERRNRLNFLEKVRNFWVAGVLEQSLHGAVLIDLGMEEQPDTVDHPWGMVLEALEQEKNRTLPSGTKIIEVFDEMGGALLILGAPGSGKTTMLLELARDTIAHAEDDPDEPMPVVLNLSSWAEEPKALAEWLVDELSAKYSVGKKIGARWIDEDQLLLLLDGLDEVQADQRETCVTAINDFRSEHGVSLAVCSRIADYEDLTTQLKLEGAVLLQPLTDQQIGAFLKQGGAGLAAVRTALQSDPTLREMAESPLMLSIIRLAYRDVSAEDLKESGSLEARRKHLFDTYLRRMFKRRQLDDDRRYSPDQTIRWLAWLARQMTQHAQTVFLIERIQSSWLHKTINRRVYAAISGMVFGILLGLLLGAVAGMRSGLNAAGGFDAWLRQGLVGSLIGLAAGGLLGGLAGGLLASLPVFSQVKTVEKLHWSLGAAMNGLIPSLVGGLVGGGIGVLFVLPLFGLIAALAAGLSVGLGFGFLIGVGFGISSRPIEQKTAPAQGIRESVFSALLIGLILLVFTGLVSGVFSAIPTDAIVGLIFGPIFGSTVALIGAAVFGGWAVLQHVTLRLILTRKGHMPANYARFLDYAAERLFLRKVGGGYIFVHRLLLEYFATLQPDDIKALGEPAA